MAFDRVSLSELYPSERPCNVDYKKVRHLISDITRDGFVSEPLKVRERRDGKLEIIEGLEIYVAISTVPANNPARSSIPVEII